MSFLLAQDIVSRTVSHESLASTAGHVILIILAVIGGLDAVQTLSAWLTGRSKQRTFNRWLVTQKLQQDTGDTEKELSSLRELVSKLQSQIDNDVPLNAKRIYLTNQRDSLAHLLGEQYEEYKKIDRNLIALGAESNAESLEKPIRDSIERTITPRYKARERKERQVRLLLALVVILIVIPSSYNPSNLIYAYFYTVLNANNYSRNDIYGTILVASFILAFFITWLGERWMVPVVDKARHHTAIWITSSAVCVLVILFTSVLLINDSSSFDSLDTSNNSSIAV